MESPDLSKSLVPRKQAPPNPAANPSPRPEPRPLAPLAEQAVVMQASVPRLLRRETDQLPSSIALALVFLAVAAQVYLPLYIEVIARFDLPLLAVVYLALDRRNVIAGLLIGAGIGLLQDGLTHGPIGVFGIIKTLIGYLAGSLSLVIEVTYPGARSVLVALFFLIHQFLFLAMQHVLLAHDVALDVPRTLILAASHAGLALLVFRPLDGLRKAR